MQMKNTGIVRNLDSLGRVVIPKELRVTLHIDIKDGLEIFVDEKTVILKKYNPGCMICESMDGIKYFREQKVCRECIDYIGSQILNKE